MILQNLRTLYKKRGRYNILFFNIVLWVASFFTLLFFFSESNQPAKIDYIYTSVFVITILIPVLINLYLLIPFFLRKERYVLFGILFLANLLLFTEINKWVFNTYIDVIFPDYFFVSYHSNTTLFFIFSLFLITTTLLELSEDWFRLNKARNEILKIENMEIATQLKSLKAQINPHFLFNSLNVLYSLSLENKKETSAAILDLSSILRYVLYETQNKKISLKQEIELIQKYLDFQQYRYQKDTSITFDVDVVNPSLKIHPMLLLPLIENSFKHGVKAEIQNTYIHMNLSQKGSEFLFTIENNASDEEVFEDKEYSGLGLENIRQNLELVYPNQHTFDILNDDQKFLVSLKIKVDEN